MGFQVFSLGSDSNLLRCDTVIRKGHVASIAMVEVFQVGKWTG
jgi:hypothetical protein